MKILNKVSMGVLAIPLAFSLSGQPVFAEGPAMVNLGAAGNFVILAKTGISTTGATSIVGDIGVSPAAATYITGFALNLSAASAFSTSPLVSGKVYAPGYANPTPSNLTIAVLDMQAAYTDAAGRAPDGTELGFGNIGGLTLSPGVYKWSTSVALPTDLTLSGGVNDVWIFQIAQNLLVASGVRVVLESGAQAKNIFWVVAGQTIIGAAAVFNGNILDQTAIVLNTGARLNGRALAQSAVTLDANVVSMPASVVATQGVSSGVGASNGGAGVVTAESGAGTSAMPAVSATPGTQAQKDQLNALLMTLQTLQDQAKREGSSQTAQISVSTSQVRTVTTDLNVGSRGSSVNTLQQFLISQGKGPAAQALAKNGATMTFGSLTRAALAEFQKSAGITPAAGYFGPKTRAYINLLGQ